MRAGCPSGFPALAKFDQAALAKVLHLIQACGSRDRCGRTAALPSVMVAVWHKHGIKRGDAKAAKMIHVLLL